MPDIHASELVVATHNKGKAREIEALLKPYINTFYTANDLDLPEPVEDGDTFEENALIKAKAAAKASGKLALADDSGLCVTALDHQPGIYSARWGGAEKDFNLAMSRVHAELGEAKDRSAYFVCVLALAWPDGSHQTFRGEVHGHITWPARGEKGFGYDPIFVADGHDKTFAEMDPAKKHAISHRAKAFEKMVAEHFSKTSKTATA